MPNDTLTPAAKAEPKACRSRISAKALETLVPKPINQAEFGDLIETCLDDLTGIMPILNALP